MTKDKIIILAIFFILFSTTFGTIEQHHPFQFASAQRNQAATSAGLDTAVVNQTGGGEEKTKETSANQNQVFMSAFDTFVTSNPQGYGVYEERDSDTFRPGETIILYIEPTGFEYGTLTDDGGNILYTIDFTADFTISNTDGNILTRQQGLPVSDIVSYSQNKEVFIPFTITQTIPFPPGNYIITYTIYDNNSRNSFDIVKEIIISEEQSF